MLIASLACSCTEPAPRGDISLVLPPSLSFGDTVTLSATLVGVADTGAFSDERITWTFSPDTALRVVARLARGVTVMAVGTGTVGVTATDGRRTATAALNVAPIPPIVASAVAGGHSWRAISAGAYFSCGLTASGEAHCWGRNLDGSLGNGTLLPASTPSRVSSSLTFMAIATGAYHACAISVDAAAHCWGSNTYGQLGSGTSSTSGTPLPVAVGGDHSFAKIAAGGWHTCGITTAGRTYCWGEAENGQTAPGAEPICGNTYGFYRCHITPREVSVPTLTELALHDRGTCGLAGGSMVYCWGTEGLGVTPSGTCTKGAHAGPGSWPCNPSPAPIGAFVAESIGSGALANDVCGVTADGRPYCWGNALPVLMDSARVFSTLYSGGEAPQSFGRSFRCGISSGSAWCWGAGQSGGLGDGITGYVGIPVRVTGISGSVVRISTGYSHACAVTESGAGYCWGKNDYGQLGSPR